MMHGPLKHETKKAAKLAVLQELRGVLHELHGQRMMKRKAKAVVGDMEEPGEGTPEEEASQDEESESEHGMGDGMDANAPVRVKKFGSPLFRRKQG